MESISVNWKSDFSVTQKLDSNLPFFAALTFGVIVIGGAFVVKYVGTMVLQVCFCITVSSIADFFLIAGTMHCLLPPILKSFGQWQRSRTWPSVH